MIISHSQNFVFVKTLKTAGSSVEYILSQHLQGRYIMPGMTEENLDNAYWKRTKTNWSKGGTIVGILNLFRSKDFSRLNELLFDLIGGKGPVRSGVPFSQFASVEPIVKIRHFLGDESFQNKFKFAIVRHPYDFALSMYEWDKRCRASQPPSKQTNATNFDSLYEWLQSDPSILVSNRRLITIDSELALDFVVKFEQLDQDLTYVANRIGIEASKIVPNLSRVRLKSYTNQSSQSRGYLLDAKSKDLIDSICEWEMDTFQYRNRW